MNDRKASQQKSDKFDGRKSDMPGSDESTGTGNPLLRLQPLFLCLGVRKAATTWVHRQLEAHPQVACTTTKEVGYWLQHYSRGAEWYENQFPTGDKYLIHAEVTPHYLNNIALQRMANDLTDVRFMVVFRNPYERAFSEYLHRVRNGERLTFSEMIKKHPFILNNSRYAKGLKVYLKYFSIDRLHVVLYEELKANPKQVVQDIYRFIGVNSDYVPSDLNTKVNVSRDYSILDHALKKLELLAKSLGVRRSHLIKLGFASKLDAIYRNISRRNVVPTLKPSDKDLIKQELNSDILELQTILGRDLSQWIW